MMCWREFKNNHFGKLSLTSLLNYDPEVFEEPLIQSKVVCENGNIRKNTGCPKENGDTI